MRKIPPRPNLPSAATQHLSKKTALITKAGNPKVEAERLYAVARKAQWFQAIVEVLRKMAGPGERCMFCSGSESSDVEHFRPKSVFPHLAMTWENYLWTCTVCNRYKGNRFASETQLNEVLINPVDENVWDFFYIDRFGNLTPQWRVDINDFDPRAVLTRTILRLDRQALQESRQSRRRELISRIEDSIARFHSKELTVEDLRHRWKDWLLSPAQPDVADYYLNGPGITEEPFATFHSVIQES